MYHQMQVVIYVDAQKVTKYAYLRNWCLFFVLKLWSFLKFIIYDGPKNQVLEAELPGDIIYIIHICNNLL